MKKIELLAPVGNIDALKAAVQAGCDAVYLGYYAFGARSKAGFDDDEIIEAIDYAHLYGVKVYITVNTIIFEDEFTELIEAVEFLIDAKADAFIVQDLGVLDYLNKTYDNIELHASTQMHIHNVAGAKVAKANGVSRVVVARELSLEEVLKIKKAADVEVEVFVHGAMCVSYSGQCLISSVSHSRSGNRGECAQNCRLKYDLVTDSITVSESKYMLSMKDLYNLENVDTLIESGIDSLKIEGRLKRPEYVFEVVSAYRNAIDKYYDDVEFDIEDKKDKLLRIFNREFTNGYLMKERDVVNNISNSHVGVNVGKVITAKGNKVNIRLIRDLNIGDGLRIADTGYQVNNMYINDRLVKHAPKGSIVTLSFGFDLEIKKNQSVIKTTDKLQLTSINKEISDNKRKVKVDINIDFTIGNPLKLTIDDLSGNVVSMTSNSVVEEALNTPLDKERVIKQFTKLGSTVYGVNNLTINCSEGATVPIKEINQLRRNVCEKLDKIRVEKDLLIKNKPSVPDFGVKTTKEYAVIANTQEQLEVVLNYDVDKIIVRDKELMSLFKDERIVYLNPRINHQGNYLNYGVIGELGGLTTNNIVASDSFMNVVNSYSVGFLHKNKVPKVALSEELTFRQIDDLVDGFKRHYRFKANLEVIIYNRKELMITRFCPISKVHGTEKNCGLCKKQFYLQNDFKELFPLIRENDCVMKVMNFKVNDDIRKIGKYKELGITNFKLIFTLEDAHQTKEVMENLKANS